GLLVGAVRGGRVGALADLRFRAPAVPFAAVALQASGGVEPMRSAPDDLRFAVVVASYAVVGAWVAVNAVGRVRPLAAGLWLAGLGWLLNLAAIAANGGMPVSTAALADVGAAPSFEGTEGNLYKHVPADGS